MSSAYKEKETAIKYSIGSKLLWFQHALLVLFGPALSVILANTITTHIAHTNPLKMIMQENQNASPKNFGCKIQFKTKTSLTTKYCIAMS